MIVYLNGTFLPDAEAHVGVTDRGLTIGDGVFDTMLAEEGRAVDADAHFTRLARHAAVLGMALDISYLPSVVAGLLQHNGFNTGRYAVRTTVTRGPASRGLSPPENMALTVIMRASPAPASPRPPSLATVQNVHRNEGSPLSRIKSVNYGDNMLALIEAQKAGADDAIMLNNTGNAACASASNIYALCDGAWLTPRLEDGAMDGITRAKLIAKGWAREEKITAAMLAQCTSLFLSNSIAGLRRAATLDARVLAEAAVPVL